MSGKAYPGAHMDSKGSAQEPTSDAEIVHRGSGVEASQRNAAQISEGHKISSVPLRFLLQIFERLKIFKGPRRFCPQIFAGPEIHVVGQMYFRRGHA
jgi:hypothetical protein